jgi:hypothetical protein
MTVELVRISLNLWIILGKDRFLWVSPDPRDPVSAIAIRL